MTIESISVEQFESALPALAEILHGCVEGGASVNFVLPFSLQDAERFWRGGPAKGLADGTRQIFVARHEGQIVGTVQLILIDLPNQRHRADVAKMLVHPSARRLGIARALMQHLEERARTLGLKLLFLDTQEGGAADGLYRSLGYIELGTVPDFALRADGATLEGATFFYKLLE